MNENESLLFKNTEVLVDTSGRISNLANHIENYGAEKFAFGTHSPILDYLTSLLRIESLRDEEADEITRNLLRSGNAQKILRI